MSLFLGIDTSNYTTSAAVYNTADGKMINCKKLLPVETGDRGLMQSKALFYHIRQLPEVTEAAFSSFSEDVSLCAVGVSTRPRAVDGSYMPVFTAGIAAASAVASSHRIPLYETCHQCGHITAALYSAGRLDLIGQRFLAFHVSGGTTEALLVEPDDDNIIKCSIVAKSTDLKAGQAIDRCGVMLGLGFPAGAALDKMSHLGILHEKIRPTIIGAADCSLSGIENKCRKMLDDGAEHNDIARFCVEYIYETIAAMSDRLHGIYGGLPVIYAGGVMSNSIIRERLSEKGGIFAQPQYSSDNAAGVAILASMLHERRKKING